MREGPTNSLTKSARVGNGYEDARVDEVCVDDVSMDVTAEGPLPQTD